MGRGVGELGGKFERGWGIGKGFYVQLGWGWGWRGGCVGEKGDVLS